jgi:bile acid transporter
MMRIACGVAVIVALWGGAAASGAEPIPLRAGPLTLVFEPDLAFLRHLRVGSDEVLRGISAPVRNSLWGTVPPQVRIVDLDRQADRFTLAFDVRCREREVDFLWRGTLVGTPDGSLDYTFEGEALADFERNRIGFCMLHGETAAGRPWRLEHTDGATEEGRFPERIAPHQPARDLRAVAHEFAPGRWAKVAFEGDVFEMEDQRNWTDASFKTYCTPLDRPRPVAVAAGTKVRQRIRLSLDGQMPAPPAVEAAEDRPVVLEVGAESHPLPGIGVQVASRGEDLSAADIARLASLRLDHLRVDLTPADGQAADRLRAAAAQARAIDASLVVALHLDTDVDAGLESVAAACRAERPPVVAWLVIAADDATFARARAVLAPLVPDALVGVGRDTNFTELNRDRPGRSGLGVASYGMNPQVHAFDEASIVETLPIQAETVRTARTFLNDVPIIVGPVTLRVQGTSRAPLPGERPADEDPRQPSAFAGGWTLGSIASLATAGVSRVTYYEAVGPKGIMAAGEVYPIYDVLRDVGDFAGGSVRAVTTSDPAAVVGLALERDGRRRLVMANLVDEPRTVSVRGFGDDTQVTLAPGEIARLDDAAGTATGAPTSPPRPWLGPAMAAMFIVLAAASVRLPALRAWTFTLSILAAVATGLAFPGWFIGVGDFRFTSLFKPLLMLIMFCMGATLSARDFAGVLRMPVAVAVGLVCQFAIMPLLGYTVATAFRFPPEVAAGIVLVGVAPSGLASNVMSYIAKANVPLSVTITALASLLSPLLTPLLMQRLAGEMIAVDAPAMMLDIAQMVLVPILLGLAFHHLAPVRRRWIEPALPAFSMAGIVAMTVLTVAVGRDNLLTIGPLLFVACLVHNLGGYLLGYCAARMLGQSRLTARTVAIEVGMQNCGLASGLAAALGKVATLGLAPIIFGPLMNTSASVLANWWRNRPVDGEAEPPSLPGGGRFTGSAETTA